MAKGQGRPRWRQPFKGEGPPAMDLLCYSVSSPSPVPGPADAAPPNRREGINVDPVFRILCESVGPANTSYRVGA